MKLPAMRPSSTALFALATLAACGKDGGVDAAYFGKNVAPPRDLAKLRPGMTLEEAKAAAPALKQGTGRHQSDWYVPSGNSDIELEVGLRDEVITDLVVKTRTNKLEPILSKAWGEAKKVPDRYSKEEVSMWFDEAAHWKADLSCLERMCFLRFTSYEPLTAAYFGKTVAPPGDFAKLRVGMPGDEAKKLIADPRALDEYVPAGPDDVSIIAQLESTGGTVSSVRLMLPVASKEQVVAAWGPGVAVKDSIGRDLTMWLDPATGWRATWETSVGDTGSLELTNYLSTDAILGTGDQLGLLPTPVLGATREDLAKAYPGTWHADGEYFELPPSALGSNWTRVNTRFDDAGKLTSVRFGIPYQGTDTAKAELLAAFEKRWGASSRARISAARC